MVKVISVLIFVLFILVYVAPYVNMQPIIQFITEDATFLGEFFLIVLNALKTMFEIITSYRLLLIVIMCYALIFLFSVLLDMVSNK